MTQLYTVGMLWCPILESMHVCPGCLNIFLWTILFCMDTACCSQGLCWGHYLQEKGLSIHLPTSTTILPAHLSSSNLSLHHLTHLQLSVSPFHPWSLSRPHSSASASSLPLSSPHLPHLSFVHLAPSISSFPAFFIPLCCFFYSGSCTFCDVVLLKGTTTTTRLCHKWAMCAREQLWVYFKPTNLWLYKFWMKLHEIISLSPHQFIMYHLRLTYYNTDVHHILNTYNKQPLFSLKMIHGCFLHGHQWSLSNHVNNAACLSSPFAKQNVVF